MKYRRCARPLRIPLSYGRLCHCRRAFFQSRRGRFAPVGFGVYDWVFVYYMCYDNDLSPHAEPIIQALSRGLTSRNVAV